MKHSLKNTFYSLSLLVNSNLSGDPVSDFRMAPAQLRYTRTLAILTSLCKIQTPFFWVTLSSAIFASKVSFLKWVVRLFHRSFNQ